jgi:hypothetical protein
MASNRSTGASIAVYLERGTRRVFACALDWPGWCRSGKDDDRALESLAAAGPRYAAVAARAGLEPPRFALEDFEVVEYLAGSATTDFGAPDRAASADHDALTSKETKRLAALVDASWKILDQVVAMSPPVLRKGPRGGGRDRDAVFEHVLGAEASYARSLGVRISAPDREDAAEIARLRQAILGALRTRAADDAGGKKKWPLPYAARRIAWHVLDHAWEIEDRSETP